MKWIWRYTLEKLLKRKAAEDSMFIPAGKLIVALRWAFWMMGTDSSLGQKISPHDHSKMSIEERRAVQKMWGTQDEGPKPEYIPTYGTTFDRVIERGHVICGTKEDFPGFSESEWDSDSDDGIVWFGFDVDICRAVAAAVLGDADAVEYVVVDGKTDVSCCIPWGAISASRDKFGVRPVCMACCNC